MTLDVDCDHRYTSNANSIAVRNMVGSKVHHFSTVCHACTSTTATENIVYLAACVLSSRVARASFLHRKPDEEYDVQLEMGSCMAQLEMGSIMVQLEMGSFMAESGTKKQADIGTGANYKTDIIPVPKTDTYWKLLPGTTLHLSVVTVCKSQISI